MKTTRLMGHDLAALTNCVHVAAMQFRVDAAVCVNEPRTAGQFTRQAHEADKLYELLVDAVDVDVTSEDE